MTLAELVEREVLGNAIELLEIQPKHLDELVKLPSYHKDPFDRLILAQSLGENIPVVTRDDAFKNYPTTLLW